MLFEALLQEAQGDVADPRVTAKALAAIVARRRERGEAPVTLGHVFPFSSHHYQLRLWLRAGHLDPDEDVRLAAVPPPVHGLDPADIVRDCPEKVLAFRAEWARSHGDEVRAVAGAVGDASRWAAAPSNRSSW